MRPRYSAFVESHQSSPASQQLSSGGSGERLRERTASEPPLSNAAVTISIAPDAAVATQGINTAGATNPAANLDRGA